MIMYRRVMGVSLALVLAGMTLASSAQAQTDTRWTPFIGCWEPAGGTSDGSLLCFRPTEDDTGVEMLTVAEGEITMTEIFRADGRAQTIEREGCSGSESANFSPDNRRIYTESLYTCEGDVTRSATGIMAITQPNMWVDVRAVGVEGEAMAWVQFYEAANPASVQEAGLGDIGMDLGMAIRSTRMAASVPVSVEQVLEASEYVDAAAVEAWIAEAGDGFDLDGESLIALADAGLDEDIIDVMVAVSNPQYFALDGRGEAEAIAPQQRAGMPVRSAWSRYPYGRYYDPFFFDPFYYGISSRYGYGYSPWGAYGVSGYGGYYGYSYTPVVVTRVEPQNHGRVVNGRGYSGGTASRPSSSGGARPSYSGGSSGSSGSGAAATRSTGSRSSGSSTGRTARRRGGGGI